MVLDFVPWARMFQGTDANLPVFAELHGLFDRQLLPREGYGKHSG